MIARRYTSLAVFVFFVVGCDLFTESSSFTLRADPTDVLATRGRQVVFGAPIFECVAKVILVAEGGSPGDVGILLGGTLRTSTANWPISRPSLQRWFESSDEVRYGSRVAGTVPISGLVPFTDTLEIDYLNPRAEAKSLLAVMRCL